jgi:hypothetical protein
MLKMNREIQCDGRADRSDFIEQSVDSDEQPNRWPSFARCRGRHSYGGSNARCHSHGGSGVITTPAVSWFDPRSMRHNGRRWMEGARRQFVGDPLVGLKRDVGGFLKTGGGACWRGGQPGQRVVVVSSLITKD